MVSQNRIAWASGMFLVLLGAVHCGVFLVMGGDWEGDVSWRKPILFGFSGGVTVLSFGWMLGKVKRRRFDETFCGMFSLVMVIEVLLITLQTWRGVPSHFNRATLLDAAILNCMEAAIVVATCLIVYVTIRSFGTITATPDMAIAIRGGASLLLFGCLFGFLMLAHGARQIENGHSHSIYGEAGVMKFPHGMPIHAIQYLPCIAWCLQRLNVNVQTRVWAVSSALISICLFTGFSLFQTFSGLARFEFTWLSAGIFATAALFLAPVILAACGRPFAENGNRMAPQEHTHFGEGRLS